MLQKYAETPKQKPQANKPYGTKEAFWRLQGLCLSSGSVDEV